MTLPKEASDFIDRFARLLPFDDSQAQEYFLKAGGLQKEDYDKLKTSYPQELVAKPLFAWMICLIYADDPVANHPVIKKDWSKIKQNALVYMYFFANIGKSKYPDENADDENNSRRNWFRVLRAIAAFKHISRNDNSTFDGIPQKLKEVEIEIDNSLNITSKYDLDPIIVERQDEDVNFAHESFRDYLVATFYVESLLLYSSSKSGDVNTKENYLKQYNLNIGFGIPDSSRIIDFLEGLLEILLAEPDIDAYVDEGNIDLRDSFGYNKKSRKNIKDKITANAESILKNHDLLISGIRDALEHNPWLRKWDSNEKNTIHKIGNLWIHLWISLFILNKLEPGLKVCDIKDLDQIMVLSSNRIPPDVKRMKGIDLSNTELSGIDLHRADLSYTNIQKAKLCGANLCEARLIEAKLMDSDLSNAKLFNAFMHGANLSSATLLRADLSGIKCSIYEESQKKERKRANFCNTNLCDANISDAKMDGIDLTDADLYRANLCDSDLSNATLRRTKLTFANLSYCNLRGAIIDGPNLAYANLSEADLVGVDFSSCFSDDKKDNFTNVNLSNAKIYEAKPIDRLLKYRSSPPINELLIKTFPGDKENEVPISTYIVACFSKSIEELHFKVSKSIILDDSQQHIASVEEPFIKGETIPSKDGKTLAFKPSCPLEYSSRYDVIIGGSAENDLAKWWFTTAPSNITTTNSGIIAMIAEKEIPNVKVIGGKAHDGNLYDRTLDGNLDTRWSNYSKHSWIKYDLGSERNICAMDIGWFKGDKRIYEFEILYSISDNDEKDYELVDPSSFRSSGKTISQERYTFAKVRARYVKIIVNGNSQNNWASITEVAIYECADSSN